jgi:hypothetical protein
MAVETSINLSPQARTFLICSIALAYHVGSAGFELAAYGELFYMRKITAWSTMTATLIALLVLPRAAANVSPWQFGVLAVPSIWLVGIMILGSHSTTITRPVLFMLATASYLVCLPYALYLIVEIVNPDLLNLEGWKPKARLAAVAIFFFLLGYGGGVRNDLFLTCEDFEIAGDTPPMNCRSSP